MRKEQEPKLGVAEVTIIPAGAGGNIAVVEGHASNSEALEELKRTVDRELGELGFKRVDPPGDLEDRRTFGFSNWDGSTWQPKGPKPNWGPPANPLPD